SDERQEMTLRKLHVAGGDDASPIRRRMIVARG
ncbi:hypothetical protein AALP_AAs55694U000100, partial [Arabis alpina]